MDILEQEYGNNDNQNKNSSKKKAVLTALIVLIALLILVIIVMNMLPKNPATKKQTLMINGEQKEIPENMILSDDEGNKYISIKEVTNMVGYQFFNGEYGKPTEDKNKCYINNSNYIVGFELESDIIYKTQVDSIIEYQNYKLNNEITEYNGNLYINIDDIAKAINILISFNEKDNQFVINTPTYIITESQKKYDENKSTIKIDTKINNQNAIIYDFLVISDSSKYGVVNVNNNETLIGTKYDSLSFDEYTKNYIAVINNKYGVIDEEGNGIIDFKYEDIEIVNYNPVLYKVKQNNKYGILDKQGKILVNISYDGMGYTENRRSNINPVMVIKNLSNKNVIVVKKDGKYGLINISNGEEVLECVLDAIYSKTTDEGELEYFAVYEGNEEVLNTEKTTTVDIT